MDGAYQQQAYQDPIQPITSTTEQIQPIPTYYQPSTNPVLPTNQNQAQMNESFIPPQQSQQQPQQQPFIPQQQGNEFQGNQQPFHIYGSPNVNDPVMANALLSYYNSNYGYS